MKIQKGILLFICLTLVSCGPVSTKLLNSYEPLPEDQAIVVVGIKDPIPENAEVLGEVKIGESLTTVKCGYDYAIADAQYEAKKVGGNAIKIIEHDPPNSIFRTCHIIRAKILKLEPPIELVEEEDTRHDGNFALLHIYRYNAFAGAALGYKLYLNDTQLCKVKNNFAASFQIPIEGNAVLWAKTESKTKVPIRLEKGKTYYVRCRLKMGVLLARPDLELMEEKAGKVEFEAFNGRYEMYEPGL